MWLAKLEEYFSYVPLFDRAALLLLTSPTRLWWEASMKLHEWVKVEITWCFMKDKIVEQYCSSKYFLSKMNGFLNLK